MADLDSSTVILQITASESTAALALSNSSNEAFLLSTPKAAKRQKRGGTPFVEHQPVTAVLRTTDFPFDPALGFVFGRDNNDDGGDGDDDNIDITIGTQAQGVSTKHFSINFNWEARTLLLKNLSGNGTLWTDPESGETERLMTSRVILGSKQYRVCAGAIDLVLRIPFRDDDQRAKYDAEVQRLHDEAEQATPMLHGLKVRSPGKATPMVIGTKRKYILGGVIGAGTSAIVHEAFDHETGDRFAAKEYTCESPDLINGMLREIKLLQELKHEHIVQYLDLFKDPDPIVIMELAPSSLAQREIKSDGQCVTLLLDILDGASYLHGERIIHRDIKPANILLSRVDPPLWKLTDFGLSKKLEVEALGTSTFCGSGMYLAPEVDGLPYSIYTYAVDLWSIGVVGVEYSCGLGLAPKQVGRKWCIAVHERSKGSGLAAFLTKMLDMAPEKRPSAKDMWQQLKERHGDRGKQEAAEAST